MLALASRLVFMKRKQDKEFLEFLHFILNTKEPLGGEVPAQILVPLYLAKRLASFHVIHSDFHIALLQNQETINRLDSIEKLLKERDLNLS